MNKKFSKLYAYTSILARISIALIPITANANWMITSLGTLGGAVTMPVGINNSGQVVGYSTTGPDNSTYHAFITGQNGIGITDMGTFGGSNSFSNGINDLGQVVGVSYSINSSPHYVELPFYFISGPDGTGGTSLDVVYGDVSAMNNSGQVVGVLRHPNTSPSAFITGPNGAGTTSLGTFGGSSSGATDINDLGQVVGYFIDPIRHARAFITGPNGTGMTDLGTLGGPGAFAIGINNSGQVVGHSWLTNSHSSAFITGPNGAGMTTLGNWDTSSSASAINNAGQVIGGYITDEGRGHAFFYSEGLITDLSLLPSVVTAGWTDIWAQAMNDNGQIVGYGSLSGVSQQAFLLSYVSEATGAVSEPGTLLLVGLGLFGLYAHRRSNVA